MNIKTIFIVGTGAMGAGIAQLAAGSGFSVNLFDQDGKQVERAIARIAGDLNRQAEKNFITPEEKQAVMSRIEGRTSLADAADADLVLEAITESLEAKQTLFRELSACCRDDVLFASNTSSISITAIASAVKHPENFLGLHFFNPATRMKLLEIIPGLRTGEAALETAKELGAALGKEIVVAKDLPGFIVNRLAAVMGNEAVFLMEAGVSPEDIDRAVRFGLNHPMGPLELAVLTGVDIMRATANTLYSEFRDGKYRPALSLERMVAAGLLGQKSGRGFYRYDERGRKITEPA